MNCRHKDFQSDKSIASNIQQAQGLMFQGSWAFTFGFVWFCAGLFDRLGHTFGHTRSSSAKGGSTPAERDSKRGGVRKRMFEGERVFFWKLFVLLTFPPTSMSGRRPLYPALRGSGAYGTCWESAYEGLLDFG